MKKINYNDFLNINNNNIMLLRIFISLFFITITLNADPADLIPKVPVYIL